MSIGLERRGSRDGAAARGDGPGPWRLDAAALESYHRQGYLVCRGVFSASEVQAMREAFHRLREMARWLRRRRTLNGAEFVLRDKEGIRDPVIERVVWCGGADPVLDAFGRDARLAHMAARILDSRRLVQIIHQAHFKLPGDGVAFPWHQDSIHRRYGSEWADVDGRGSYVQTVTAVDDMEADNGPLRVLEGSHRLGHLGLPPGELPPEARKAFPRRTLEVEAGSVVLFGPFLFHSSEPNRSDRPRRAFINGFALPGANRRCYPGCGLGRLVSAP